VVVRMAVLYEVMTAHGARMNQPDHEKAPA